MSRYSVALTEAEVAVKKAFMLTEAERDTECEPAMPPSQQSACGFRCYPLEGYGGAKTLRYRVSSVQGGERLSASQLA